jgi:hypothetical protein
MKQKQLIGLAVLAGLAYYLYSRQQAAQYTGQFRNVPPPPPRTSPNYQVWVNTILQTFGQVADLWKPGGQLYKSNVPPPAPGGSPVNNPAAPGGVF